MLKRSIYTLLLLFLFVNKLSFAKELVNIVAKVNDKIITNIDLENRYNISTKLSDINIDNELEKKLIMEQLLQEMIKEKLQMIEIKKENIQLEKDEFEYALNNIAKDYGGNLQKFFIKNNISYDDYVNHIKIKILFHKFIQKKIAPKIRIKNSDINEMLEINNIEKELISNLIYQIYITSSNVTKSQMIANKLFEELKNGADFKKISKEFSSSTSLKSNGRLGWINKNEFNPELYNKIENLEIGEFSEPILFNNDYYIFKIADRKKIPNVNIDNLDKIRNIIFNKKLAIEVRDFISNLKKNNIITIYEFKAS